MHVFEEGLDCGAAGIPEQVLAKQKTHAQQFA